MVATQVELAKSIEENPLDEDARFSLIDAMADSAEVQCVIFMYESGMELPVHGFYWYGDKGGAGGSGSLGGMGRGDRLLGTGVVRRGGSGRFMALTDEGKRFGEWLVRKGRKCDYFWTESGGWGTPEPGSHEEKWLRETQEQARNWHNRIMVTDSGALQALPESKENPANDKNGGENK
jgi:hypothetical protein